MCRCNHCHIDTLKLATPHSKLTTHHSIRIHHPTGTRYGHIQYRVAFVEYIPTAGDFHGEVVGDAYIGIAAAGNFHEGVAKLHVEGIEVAGAGDFHVEFIARAFQYDGAGAGNLTCNIIGLEAEVDIAGTRDVEVDIAYHESILAGDAAGAGDFQAGNIRNGNKNLHVAPVARAVVGINFPDAAADRALDMVDDVLLAFDAHFLVVALGDEHIGVHLEVDACKISKVDVLCNSGAAAVDAAENAVAVIIDIEEAAWRCSNSDHCHRQQKKQIKSFHDMFEIV